MVRNVWVGHAVAEYVHVTESKEVQLKFLVQHANTDPPQDWLNAGKMGKLCTVEFLTKMLPDRYTFCPQVLLIRKILKKNCIGWLKPSLKFQLYVSELVHLMSFRQYQSRGGVREDK